MSSSRLYKFIKEEKGLFDGAHAIYTPEPLVNRVLSKIDLQGDILVLFNIEFVISLVYNYNIDSKKITLYSDHENKDKIANRLGVNIIKNLDTDMKFDVVIGNPPYHDDSTGNSSKTTNLYVPFFYKSISLIKETGIVSMIIPSDWIGPNKSTFKDYIFSSNHIKQIELHTYQKYFKVKKATCNVILDKSYIGNCEFVDEFGNSKFINLKEQEFLSKNNSDISYRNLFANYPTMGYRWLRGKLNRNQIIEDPNGIEYIEGCGKSNGPLDIKKIPSSLENTGAGLHKIVMPNVGGTKGDLGNNVKVAEQHQVGGHGVVFLITNSKTESENLLSYLNTKPIKELIKRIKTSSPNSKVLFEKIPDVDLSIKWNDQKVYKHFGFNQKTIDYVKSL